MRDMSLNCLLSMCESSSKIAQQMAEKLIFINRCARLRKYTYYRLAESLNGYVNIRRTGLTG
jgi:NH3-dependent NAD+ synthetase